jgi:hypothetical protein
MSILAEIQTRHLANTSQKLYHLMMLYPLFVILTDEYTIVQSIPPFSVMFLTYTTVSPSLGQGYVTNTAQQIT